MSLFEVPTPDRQRAFGLRPNRDSFPLLGYSSTLLRMPRLGLPGERFCSNGDVALHLTMRGLGTAPDRNRVADCASVHRPLRVCIANHYILEHIGYGYFRYSGLPVTSCLAGCILSEPTLLFLITLLCSK